ncbi:hypothetical protein MMAD_02840 [Mycolicibacterium madagascariense]|uniref:Glycosyl transferase family 1 n=1 Tax=Mycolicibacterium madagascariense TaxID=212765 RepID=A0A7I7X813_9MYCO|nr:hypothetical protein [Mycolicibacterium madagascariense]MCV7012750.1 hypothetical protein [Mycolicibacterium madagascariense]BBZ25989.1 hypothetical protein MMAD_02840 [Mycolicibacterium madagascariense]
MTAASSTGPLVHLVIGPQQHGVVRFGVELHAAWSDGFAALQRWTGPAAELPGDAVPAGCGVHLQFTDRLFGADAVQAAAVVDRLAAGVHRGGGRVTVTLHDLPHLCDLTNYATRARGYVALAAAVDGIVVSSEHERELLRDIGIGDATAVVPLPIAAPVIGQWEATADRSVAVFGFVYPGKGHDEVLHAMQGLPPDVRLLAVGEPSAGHDDLIVELEELARAQGRPFVTTGYVTDDDLPALLRSVTVPVVHHRHVSASGSLNSWLSAGRRPLAPATRYTREIAQRNPKALWLFDDRPGALADALRAALADPTATWLPPGTVCTPSWEEAGAAYRRVLGAVHG